MIVKRAQSEEDFRRIAPVLLQLRPSFTTDSLVAQILRQQAEGFHVAYVEADGEVLCVAGYVFGTKLAWGKHIYVDDLVTDEQRRSTGAGKAMIDWLKAEARAAGCQSLQLDSGVQRFRAHGFYLREGFHISAHHFAIADLARV
jgi:GNAT superfamily N-acetyltransferase